GGTLKANYVLHAVGPIYKDGTHGEPELLKGAYLSCLKLASDHAVKSLSFPSISTGVYGYPIEDAAKIALTTVIDYLKTHQEIVLVRFVLFGTDAYNRFEKILNEIDN
ncbi:MAG: macro domain-containing protein, partial [Candidatus Scalindua sp.]|nr:macro domain-containing protein [Candidatus Scalindua sp.]